MEVRLSTPRFFCAYLWCRLSSALRNTDIVVEKHFQKPFQALCFKITYFIYDLDYYQEFARTGAVMSYDLLFNLNKNLDYVKAEFQIDNNPNYARQKANGAFVNCVFIRCCCCSYPMPSEGWGHGGRPWSHRSRLQTLQEGFSILPILKKQ